MKEMTVNSIPSAPVASWTDDQIITFIERNPLRLAEADCCRLQNGGAPIGSNQEMWKQVYDMGRHRGILGISSEYASSLHRGQLLLWGVRSLSQ